jgi:hypothetical protein
MISTVRRSAAPYLDFPEEFRRTFNFRRKTLVHGAIQSGLFQHFALRTILRQRNMNF